MTETPRIDIKILDKKYRLKCPDDQKDQLLKSASYLNDKMIELKSLNNSISTDEIATIAALNVVSELLDCMQKEQNIKDVSDTIKDIQHNIDNSL
ncbi:MAG: cell division protein ZapA [Gammaproteobacteria bacterium]|nr:MAG: cell division protein ZapA [Gammaproteobacteria bacterium]